MCGGIVQIFVQELSSADARGELTACRAHATGVPVAIATLLDGERAGHGWPSSKDQVIGGLARAPLLDRNVARETAGLLEEGKTPIRRFGADGATLGDDLRVHIHAFAPPPKMVIFGAIDFSAALAPFAAADRLRGEDHRRPRAALRAPRASPGRRAGRTIGWPQEVDARRHAGTA